MALGPGKYDDICTQVREKTQAKDGVILIINNGNLGSGFSVQAPIHITILLPKALRQLADQIEADLRQGKL